jgi:hypothetical protein
VILCDLSIASEGILVKILRGEIVIFEARISSLNMTKSDGKIHKDVT